MRTIHEWLDEYNESHGNRINKLAHWVCVPAIVFSLLGLLWEVKTPVVIQEYLPGNLAIIIALLALCYYFILSTRLALGMIAVLAIMFTVVMGMEYLSLSIWSISLGIFVIAWTGQFIGHMVEGKRPSFFKDLQFLMIGPLWLLSFIYQRVGIRY